MLTNNVMIANPPEAKAEGAAATTNGKQFRRLRADELVGQGDFIADGKRGFKPWEGPGGFRADAFVKPIYRKMTPRQNGSGKTS